MDLALGSWLLSPDGELIYIGHKLADGESFADYVAMIRQIILPHDDDHTHLLRAHFTSDEQPTDYLLVAADRVTPDGYIIMKIVPPLSVSC